MRRAITGLFAALFLLTLAVPASADVTEPLDRHCPGAVDETSPNYVAVPDGYEIVIDNDTTEGEGGVWSAADRNAFVPTAGTIVCIKAGDQSSGIFVADGTTSLSGYAALYGLVNKNGQVLGISYFMTYKLVRTDPGQWCSPGFWKNSPAKAAFAASQVTNWPEGASLENYVEILNNPQQYASSGLYEAVADALSQAHPDVNFLGERVEDSCPLRADAADQLKTLTFAPKKK